MPARKSAPVLTIVPANEHVAEVPRPETPADRIRRLQAEARGLAKEHIGVLTAQLEATAALCREIAEGGEAYPVGAREIARRLADELPRTAQGLSVIVSRT